MHNSLSPKPFVTLAGVILFTLGNVGAVDLNQVSKNADVIVVGSLTTRIESATSVSFELNIERVLKGNATLRTARVSHEWTRQGIVAGEAPGGSSVEALCRGIWFLLRRNSMEWDAVSVRSPHGIFPSLYLPAVERLPSNYELPSGASWLDTVVVEIAAGFESSPQGADEVLWALHSFDSPAVPVAISHLSTSTNSRVRAAAMAESLARGDSAAVERLVESWTSIHDAATKELLASVLENSFRDTNPSSVRQIAALAAANPVHSEIRQSAITALAAIHTKETLPFLATLLDSSDPWEQMKGVYGISAFVNGCPIQTVGNASTMKYLQCSQPSPYRTKETMDNFGFRRGLPDQEARLITYWSAWWGRNGDSVSGAEAAK